MLTHKEVREQMERVREQRRKNYLFAGSDAGAERAAVLYSLLRTAAVAGIEPTPT